MKYFDKQVIELFGTFLVFCVYDTGCNKNTLHVV